MKKTIVSAMLIASQCLLISISFAQGGKMPPEERADKMTERMKTALHLTADQAVKAKEINTKTLASGREIREKYKNMMLAEMKNAENEADSQYKRLLTARQYEIYSQKKEKKKEYFNHKERRQDNRKE